MNQLVQRWNLLTPQRKLVFGLATIALFVTVFSFFRLASTPSMSLLYSGLDQATAGEIVASLEQKGIPFEVRGDAIYADSSQRDQARLALASEGLPSNGIAGYELLDGLSGFGTTTQMFDAAYWRAKEGELARTILSSSRISMARVHIANAVQRPFDRSSQPTASVTVTGRNGMLDIGQAEAIRHLVASAVSGLSPDQVAVIDTNYGVILQPGMATAAQNNSSELDGRAQELKANIERLLEARVGAGNAIVEVMVEATGISETTTQRLIDPDGTVPISSETENSSETSSGGGANTGAVTVASNLPDTGAAPADGTNSSTQTQTRERINYEISETLREQVRLPGEIARLSVAVLVNAEAVVAANGTTTYTPRSTEELTAFQALVQSAVGFNAERGDVVTIETLQFPTPIEAGTTATAGFISNFAINIPLIIQMAILALVATILGMFVVRPILLNATPEMAQLPAGQRGLGEDDEYIDGSPLKAIEQTRDPIEILRETIAKRSDDTSFLLRNWIESDQTKTEEPTDS